MPRIPFIYTVFFVLTFHFDNIISSNSLGKKKTPSFSTFFSQYNWQTVLAFPRQFPENLGFITFFLTFSHGVPLYPVCHISCPLTVGLAYYAGFILNKSPTKSHTSWNKQFSDTYWDKFKILKKTSMKNHRENRYFSCLFSFLLRSILWNSKPIKEIRSIYSLCLSITFTTDSKMTEPTTETSRLQILNPVMPIPPRKLKINPPIIPTKILTPAPILLLLSVNMLAIQPARTLIIIQLIIPSVYSLSFKALFIFIICVIICQVIQIFIRTKKQLRVDTRYPMYHFYLHQVFTISLCHICFFYTRS